MLDGPVDAIWIENMNKKLCLPNSEIIQVGMMFFSVTYQLHVAPMCFNNLTLPADEPHYVHDLRGG